MSYQQYPGQYQAYPGAQQYPGAPAPQYPGAAPQYPGAAPQYPGAAPQYPGAAPQYPGAAPQYPGAAPQYPGQYTTQNSGVSVGYIGGTPNQPTAYVNQGWANRGSYPGQVPQYPGQVSQYPGQNVNRYSGQYPGQQPGYAYPSYYVVFDPTKYSATNNPWSKDFWMQSYDTTAQPPQTQTPPPQTQTPPPQQQTTQPSQPPPQQQAQSQPQQTPPPPQQPAQLDKPQPRPPKTQTSTPQQSTSGLQQPKRSIFQFESIEQFQELRQHATIDSALKQLGELGQDLSKVDPNSFQPDPNSVFVVCNSYTKPQYKLGVGPINDAITCSANLKYMGFKVYFLHNSTTTTFLQFFQAFLQKTSKNLILYYTGHGAQVKDKSGDEEDGYDEVMIFDNHYIVDDKLAEYIIKYFNQGARMILLADCCHSGTIWDIPETVKTAKAKGFPKNVMSISAASDNQTAKQTQFNKANQGVFTFNFWTIVRNNPKISAKEAKRILDPELKRFNQMFIALPTSEKLDEEPIFPSLRRL